MSLGGLMKNLFYSIIVIVTSAFILTFFQGCSESKFNAIDSTEKLSTLANHSGLGFGDTNSETGDGGLSTLPMGQTDNGSASQPPKQTDSGSSSQTTPTKNNQFDAGLDTITDPLLGRFNVIRWCRGRDSGATLKEAKSIKIVVKDSISKEIKCEASGANLLAQIVSTGKVDIPNCNFSGIANNRLIVQVTNEKNESLSDGTENSSASNAFGADNNMVVKSDDGRSKFTVVALHLLLDKNVNFMSSQSCDAYNSSPLVVDMRSASEQRHIFELSEPSLGIDFDILGLNSTPSIHSKKRISWFQDPRIMPIVLPKNGGVEGINELFGDNTLGPDNEFAKNGFAALSKYDGLRFKTMTRTKADGYINKKDEVYFKLKVWYDRNLDGVAQANELFSLQRAGIETIDLNFDANYYSRDQYGNEIKYKSVVKLTNGKLKPIFDIWFTVNNLIQE
jgi:hypothetical protein